MKFIRWVYSSTVVAVWKLLNNREFSKDANEEGWIACQKEVDCIKAVSYTHLDVYKRQM